MLLRAFVAVELPAPLRDPVAAVQATLRAAGADVKWVEPPHLHLTLKFLGDLDVKALQTVERPGGPPAPVNHVTLLQSTLSPRGPIYTPLAEYRLQ